MKPTIKGEIRLVANAKIIVLSPDEDSYNAAKQIAFKAEPNRKIAAKAADHSLSIEELSKRNFELDDSKANRSSIAFLLELDDTRGLFLADAHPDVIVNSIREFELNNNSDNKLELSFIKISHHGSRKNTNDELLDIIECQNYVISSNGTNGHLLPDKEALVRIIKKGTIEKPVNIFFTHDDKKLRAIFTHKELTDKAFHFNIHYPNPILTYPFQK